MQSDEDSTGYTDQSCCCQTLLPESVIEDTSVLQSTWFSDFLCLQFGNASVALALFLAVCTPLRLQLQRSVRLEKAV